MTVVKVWVAVDSGTWGDASHLRLLEVNETAMEEFENMSDSERSMAALRFGRPVTEVWP